MKAILITVGMMFIALSFYGQDGFDSNQSFTKWKLKGSRGTVNIKNESTISTNKRLYCNDRYLQFEMQALFKFLETRK